MSIESSIDGTDTTSKIDSIASKYRRDSRNGRSTRLSIDANNESNNVESISKVESSYERSKNGESITDSKYSKIMNGSVSEDISSKKSYIRSESSDGKPIFTMTLEGQNIERKYKTVRRVANTSYIEVDTLSACTYAYSD